MESRQPQVAPRAEVVRLLGGGFANRSLYMPLEDPRDGGLSAIEEYPELEDVHLVYGYCSGLTLAVWLEASVKSALQACVLSMKLAQRDMAIKNNPNQVVWKLH